MSADKKKGEQNKMNKRNKKYIELRVPKPSETTKDIFKIAMYSIFFVLWVFLFVEFIIPAILFIINSLILLVQMYIINFDNIYIVFFGGLAFLVIGWKITSSVMYIWYEVMKEQVIDINKFMNKLK
jgi:hypothetical protein